MVSKERKCGGGVGGLVIMPYGRNGLWDPPSRPIILYSSHYLLEFVQVVALFMEIQAQQLLLESFYETLILDEVRDDTVTEGNGIQHNGFLRRQRLQIHKTANNNAAL